MTNSRQRSDARSLNAFPNKDFGWALTMLFIQRHSLTTMQEIFGDIDKFQTKLLPCLEKGFRQLASKQQPRTLCITCCESRVVPNTIALAKPRELFICRMTGNIVPVHGSEDKSVVPAIDMPLPCWKSLTLLFADIPITEQWQSLLGKWAA